VIGLMQANQTGGGETVKLLMGGTVRWWWPLTKAMTKL